jgi:hypothetical protein
MVRGRGAPLFRVERFIRFLVAEGVLFPTPVDDPYADYVTPYLDWLARRHRLAKQYSVEPAIRHAVNIGYRVTMIRDCCAFANTAGAEASLAAKTMMADIVDSNSINS